jgi:hypothetical protein
MNPLLMTKRNDRCSIDSDRVFPRRPFIHQPKAGQIDKLLAGQLPVYFSQIKIGGGG